MLTVAVLGIFAICDNGSPLPYADPGISRFGGLCKFRREGNHGGERYN